MAEVYHNNIIDIDLESGTLFRSFLNHTIGSGDNNANWYGVRVFRKGEPIALSGCSVQGLFMPASGSAILISDGTHTWVSGNEAAILLPQACYNVKGRFTLTIKIIGTNSYSITDTVRIIDGVVADTYSENPVAPTAAVPTYQEILAVYEQMVAAKEGSVRFDIDQTLTTAQMTQARGNIAAASESDVSDLKSALNCTYAAFVEIPLEAGAIATNQGVGNPVSYTVISDTSWRHCVVNCKKGDLFDINGIGGNSPKAWCFVDADDIIVSVATDNTNVLIISAPVDGRLIYNSSSAAENRHCYYAANARTSIDDNYNIIMSQQNFNNFNFYETINKDRVIFTGSPAIGGTVDTDSQFRTLGIGNLVILCSAGDKFKICGKVTDSSGNFRLWCFIDATNKILMRSGSQETDATSTPIVVTAPANAARLICNMDALDGSYVVKLYDNSEEITAIVREKAVGNPYDTYDYTPTLKSGYAVSMGSVGSFIGSPYTSAIYSLFEVPCEAGDIFELKAYNDTGTAHSWAFVDSNGVILARSVASSYGNDTTWRPRRLMAPANAAKFYVNVRTAVDPDCYLIKLGNYAAVPPTVVNDNTTQYKIMFPRLADQYDFIERNYVKSNDFVDFSTLYQLFHALNTSDLIEETNLSTAYLTSNPTDELPSYISGITDGGMYMWHVLPPQTDGSTYTAKGKRLKMMLFSGVHGGEKKSIWDLYYLLKDIKDNADNPVTVALRNFVDLYIVPLECPYGIENNSRYSYGDINPNRDFWNPHWTKVPDSGDAYNQLYETRCVSWWIEQLAPDAVIDHHTSTGDNSIENGKFLAWGDSPIPSINSLVEQVITQVSPMVRKEYASIFGSYDWVYGHTQDIETYLTYGTLPLFAYFKTRSISAGFEVVLGCKWDGVTVISSSDADQTALMTIDDCFWRNFLMTFTAEAVKLINGELRY